MTGNFLTRFYFFRYSFTSQQSCSLGTKLPPRGHLQGIYSSHGSRLELTPGMCCSPSYILAFQEYFGQKENDGLVYVLSL